MSGPKVDFLFLDGLRPIEEVAKDFNCYVTLVRKGGLLAVDGIGGNTAPPPDQDGGFRLWQQLKPKIPQNAEYLTGIGMPRRGIGMVVIS